jgi:signal peptidase I
MRGRIIMNQAAPNKKRWNKFGTPIGILLCIVLILVLIVNITLIVGSYVNPDKVPSFLGYKPFIVLSGSMEPEILPGDLIVTKEVDPEDVKVGDVITFRTDKTTAVSHRVTEISTDGGLSFLTKGDANIGADKGSVLPESIEGKYILRVAKLGSVALFLQTPIGLLVFVVIPLCLFILYDIVSRNARGKRKTGREAELEAELEALKAAAGTKEAVTESDSPK